jgi:LacI family transcriptional regulator
LTAICCTTDTLAIGALCECRALGVRVPEEISVAGFSDLDIVSELDPPLSSVHIPAEQIGTAIADFLLDGIAGRSGLTKIELEATMILRQSTGPARTVARPARRRLAI